MNCNRRTICTTLCILFQSMQYFKSPHGAAVKQVTHFSRVVNIRRHVSDRLQRDVRSSKQFFFIIIIRKLYFCETECQPPSLIFSQIKVRIDLQLDPEFHMGEVRKIQKKLRQIENLEIKISLTPEEIFKVQKQIMCLSFVSLTPGSAIPVLISLTSHDCGFCFQLL